MLFSCSSVKWTEKSTDKLYTNSQWPAIGCFFCAVLLLNPRIFQSGCMGSSFWRADSTDIFRIYPAVQFSRESLCECSWKLWINRTASQDLDGKFHLKIQLALWQWLSEESAISALDMDSYRQVSAAWFSVYHKKSSLSGRKPCR